jgi:hypothetical protein
VRVLGDEAVDATVVALAEQSAEHGADEAQHDEQREEDDRLDGARQEVVRGRDHRVRRALVAGLHGHDPGDHRGHDGDDEAPEPGRDPLLDAGEAGHPRRGVPAEEVADEDDDEHRDADDE